MYERAKYFSNKFIRNGIAGSIICGILIFSPSQMVDPGSGIRNDLQPIVLFLVATILWLYFGIRIYVKLKSKAALNEPEISDERISFRQVEVMLSLLLFLVIFLGMKHWRYANYVAIPVLIGYAWWMYSQMKLVNNYLNG